MRHERNEMPSDIQTELLIFGNNFNYIGRHCHDMAVEKGWWDRDRHDAELIALIHSELSEALEGLRAGNPPDDKIPQFSSAEAELADAVIRIMDMAAVRGWNVGGAIAAKIAFNATRPHKHGGKVF